MPRAMRILLWSIPLALSVGIVLAVWALLTPGDPPALSAAEIVKQACDKLVEEEDYDAVMISTFEQGTVTHNYEYSGDDFRSVSMAYDNDGNFAGKGEFIVKDGVWYFRGSASPDDLDTYGDWQIFWADTVPDIPYPCFPVEDTSAQASPSTGDDPPSERLIEWEEISNLEDEIIKRQLTVDETGRPVKGLTTVVLATSDSQPAPAQAASGTPMPTPTPKVIEQVEETYSGFGEKNTVTAPIATPTPVPVIETAYFYPTSAAHAGGFMVPTGCTELWECLDEPYHDGDSSKLLLFNGGAVRLGFTVGADAVPGTVTDVRFEVTVAAAIGTLQPEQYSFVVYSGSDELATMSGNQIVGTDYPYVRISGTAITDGLSGSLNDAEIRVNGPTSGGRMNLTKVVMVVEYNADKPAQ